MSKALLELLRAARIARTMIRRERQALVFCHTNKATGQIDPEVAEDLAQFDKTLAALDAAIAQASKREPS